MRLRLSLIEDSGHERLSVARPLKVDLPGMDPMMLLRSNAALLVGEAEDLIAANGLLADVLAHDR